MEVFALVFLSMLTSCVTSYVIDSRIELNCSLEQYSNLKCDLNCNYALSAWERAKSADCKQRIRSEACHIALAKATIEANYYEPRIMPRHCPLVLNERSIIHHNFLACYHSFNNTLLLWLNRQEGQDYYLQNAGIIDDDRVCVASCLTNFGSAYALYEKKRRQCFCLNELSAMSAQLNKSYCFERNTEAFFRRKVYFLYKTGLIG